MLSQFHVGQEVSWLYESRRGYNTAAWVIARVVKLGLVRVKIETHQKIDGEWRVVKKWVTPDRLKPVEDLEARAEMRKRMGI